ncbi:hypothetical protein C8R44DRAFT_876429 [Mycena epipterygia]|nr:hypothetical protein C8R44DRAFT_876429 [Mycena epipterygia]
MLGLPSLVVIALLISARLLTAASINIPASIPDSATSLELVDSNRTVIAFDIEGTELGRYKVDSTTEPTNKEPSGVPLVGCSFLNVYGGYWALPLASRRKLEHAAGVTIGDFVPTLTGDGCVGQGPFQITSGAPLCREEILTTEGVIVGQARWVTLYYESGFSTTATMKTTNITDIIGPRTVSVTMRIPGLGGSSADVTTSHEVKNMNGWNFSTTVDQISNHSVSLFAPANSRCFLEYDSSQCLTTGSARLSFIAAGWIKYTVTTGYKSLNLDAYLTEEGRTTYLEINGNLESQSKIEFHGTCVPV